MVESGEKWCVVERMWQSGCGAIHEVVRGETAISGDKRVFIMFMGEYSHTIDAKGRLIIPSKFREQLGEEFVLTKGLDGCLSIYPNDEWAAFEEKLRALPLTNKNARTFTRFFVAGATNCELDKQGRILLPANLREYAGIDKEVVSVGVFSRVEIWSKERYLENNDFDDMDEIAEHMAELGIGI